MTCLKIYYKNNDLCSWQSFLTGRFKIQPGKVNFLRLARFVVVDLPAFGNSAIATALRGIINNHDVPHCGIETQSVYV